MNDQEAEIYRDGLTILRGLLTWELSPARWEGVMAILEAMATSLELGDRDTMAKATVDLERIGPVRFKRIGAESKDPPPAPVRERTNELIHRLSGKAGENA
jgi:hypothetical protein